MRFLRIYGFLILTLLVVHSALAQSKPYKSRKFKEKCWTRHNESTLLGVMKTIIQLPMERTYQNDNYIQTFGCAYENDDIEQNSIQAVYRAIDQSLRNRKVTARDNLLGLLRSRPPRPDNLARDYTIYVNMVKSSQVEQARYEVKILDLEVVPTFESNRAVWTRIVTRFAYQDDFKKAPTPADHPSEFVEVMALAEKILESTGKGKFKKADELIESTQKPTFDPTSIDELIFGDYLTLFDQSNPDQGEIPAIFVGKGLYLARIPKFGTAVLKFGEERLFGLCLDSTQFHRASNTFVNLQYHAPEAVLQCLLMRFGNRKPFFLLNSQRQEDETITGSVLW
ncbi:MAG: hypothetical protein ACE5HO_17135 [bacterium]